MKNKLNKFTAALMGVMVLTAAIALPSASAFAQTGGIGISVTASATAGPVTAGLGTNVRATTNAITKIVGNAQTRADQEITRRINALNALSMRVNAMTKISSSSQASLSANITTQIGAMNTLQAQIATDAAADSTSSLKADIQSITKSYRIFMLIIPQGAIEAAADRVLDIGGMMTTLAGQLQTRITTAQTAGNDMSASISILADMNTQITNATASANAAISEISSLQPDNGVQSVMTANTAALKDARSKVQAAQQDLTAARKDAGMIVKTLTGLKASGAASGATSSTVTASATVE